MRWRKWLIRGLVFTVVGGLAAAGFLYQRWTNPTAVRQEVLEKLKAEFAGAEVSLESARLRLFGGIALSEVRLARRNDPEHVDFAYFPSVILYHDKERLLNGKLAIRKVELHRPRLRASRDREGRWNLENLLPPVSRDQPIPTVVVHHGTLVLEDQAATAAAAVEIKDVSLTVVNASLPTLTFQGKGISDLIGPVHLSGTWHRLTKETAFSIQAPAVPVGPLLVQRLEAYLPDLTPHARQLEGSGKLQADFGYCPTNARPWSHDLRCQLSQGKLSHPHLPLPLDHLEAELRCLDGHVTLERLSAQSGATRIQLKGKASRLSPDTDFEGALKVEKLLLTPELFARLPESLRGIHADFAPAGLVGLTCDFARRGGHWSKRCVVHAQNASATCLRFPYLVDRITGTLDLEIDSRTHVDRLKVDLIAHAGARPVYIRGQVDGDGYKPAVTIDISGADIPLDEKLLAALPAPYQARARSFHATGRCDFVASIRRARGHSEYANRYHIYFHHAALRFDEFPYPLEDVTGRLEIGPDHWEFREFRGSHKGGEFRVQGSSQPTPAGDRLDIEVRGSNALLDPELESALDAEMKKAWKMFTPGGRMDFVAQVERLPGERPDIKLAVTARGCTIRPSFFPYGLTELTGSIRYAQRWVYLNDLRARHGESQISLGEGKVYLHPTGGVWAKLTDLRGSPLLPDQEFHLALPAVLQKLYTAIQLKSPVALRTQVVINTPPEAGSPPAIYWDGEVRLRRASLQLGLQVEQVTGLVACRGLHNGRQLEDVVGNILLEEASLLNQPFHKIHSLIEVKKEAPEILILPGLRAHLFGGQVYGPIRVELGPILRYELNLTASQIKLEEFGRHNLGPNAQVSGLAMARLFLAGQGPGLSGLEGRGSIDVPNGKMYNLPPLLQLLKVLGLHPPDRTAFEEAHATFTIRGPRVQVSQVDLLGNAISLSGKGEMNLDGSDVSLDFYAVWSRVMQVLPPVIDKIPPAISKNLLKIKMRGRLEDVKCTKEPVPVLADSLREIKGLMERMRGSRAAAGGP
jgi:hypothetical protein